jgi:hypothetical protein
MAVTMKMAVLWVVAPCILVHVSQHFRTIQNTVILENLHVRNTSRGKVNAKVVRKKIPKIFLCISVVKNVVTCHNV